MGDSENQVRERERESEREWILIGTRFGTGMDNHKPTIKLTGEGRTIYNHFISPASLRMQRRKHYGSISNNMVTYEKCSCPDTGTRLVKDTVL